MAMQVDMKGWWCVWHGDALAWDQTPSAREALRRSLDLHRLGDWTDDVRKIVVFPQDYCSDYAGAHDYTRAVLRAVGASGPRPSRAVHPRSLNSGVSPWQSRRPPTTTSSPPAATGRPVSTPMAACAVFRESASYRTCCSIRTLMDDTDCTAWRFTRAMLRPL